MPVRCGNRQAHGADTVHHQGAADVRECFQASQPEAPKATGAKTFTPAEEEAQERYWNALRDWEDERANALRPPATMSEAHAEWHRNSGVPMGQPGCPQDACDPDYLEEKPELPDDLPVAVTPLWDGIYTVETPLGHQTFRIRTQPEDADFAPGKQVIAYLSGADNENDYTGFGFVHQAANGARSVSVWKRFQGRTALLANANLVLFDPDRWLTEAHCFRCGRRLTVPASVHAGYGPECAKKAG